MASSNAYRVKQDISIPRALREVETLVNGQKIYEVEGVNYPTGSVVLAENISPPVRERVENGELDEFLEPISDEEAASADIDADRPRGTFVPEHEVERHYLGDYGHEVVSREQQIEANSAGAEGAKDALELAKSEGLDERDLPRVGAEDAPSLAEVSRGDADPVPTGEDAIELGEGVEQPPGHPIGETQAAARGSSGGSKRRKRPSRKSKSEDGDGE